MRRKRQSYLLECGFKGKNDLDVRLKYWVAGKANNLIRKAGDGVPGWHR